MLWKILFKTLQKVILPLTASIADMPLFLKIYALFAHLAFMVLKIPPNGVYLIKMV